MASPILLNNVDHADLRVVLDRGAAYGDSVNQAVVFATEFEELQRDYAILFRRDPAGVYRATILLGFEAEENLYLDGVRWDANYIPALMSRGPFSIGVPSPGEEGEPMIHVDPAHSRIRQGGEGAPIFLDHGGNAPLLDRIAEVLQRIYVGTQVGPAMFAAFEAHALIEPVELRIETDAGRRYTVPDCYTIAQDRLAALDGPALAALHRDDFLRPAIWAASSLGNIARLVERKQRRDA
jgi:hypothetical protein